MATSTAFTNSRVARGVAIKTIFKDLRAGNVAFLPQRIAIFGQGSSISTYSTVKAQITSASEAGNTYGFGSPIHLAALQMFPINGDGVGSIPVTVYPLDDDGTGVVSDGDITPSGTITAAAQYTVEVNNIVSEPFVISVADTVAAIVTAMTTAINAVLGNSFPPTVDDVPDDASATDLNKLVALSSVRNCALLISSNMKA